VEALYTKLETRKRVDYDNENIRLLIGRSQIDLAQRETYPVYPAGGG